MFLCPVLVDEVEGDWRIASDDVVSHAISYRIYSFEWFSQIEKYYK